MRHSNGYRKLNRTHEHRKAMFANMCGSLIEHEQIENHFAQGQGTAADHRKADYAAKLGAFTPAVRPMQR